MTAITLIGGDAAMHATLESVVLSVPGITTIYGPAAERADVVLVAGDPAMSALDRCRLETGRRVCVLVTGEREPSIDQVREGMEAGARGVISWPPDPTDLQRAITSASGFGRAAAEQGMQGTLIVVTAGAGGQGCSRLAAMTARSSSGVCTLVDLDLAGGTQAELAGLEDDLESSGLAGEPDASRVMQRLGRDADYGTLIPAPRRPDLAWLIDPQLPSDVVDGARRVADVVVADVGRAAGPAIPVVQQASVVLVASRPDARSLRIAAAHADLAERLGVERERVRIVVVGANLGHQVTLRLSTAEARGRQRIILPDSPGLRKGRPDRTARRLLCPIAGRRGAAT